MNMEIIMITLSREIKAVTITVVVLSALSFESSKVVLPNDSALSKSDSIRFEGVSIFLILEI